LTENKKSEIIDKVKSTQFYLNKLELVSDY